MGRNAGVVIKYGKIEIGADGVSLDDAVRALLKVLKLAGYPEAADAALEADIKELESELQTAPVKSPNVKVESEDPSSPWVRKDTFSSLKEN